MSAFILKLIAILAMVCDHVGAELFPNMLWLRAVGRLTMPIMSYFAAIGYRKTRSVPKYLLRLGIFAILSEPCYYILFQDHSNVIITIFLGVASLYIADLLKNKTKREWTAVFPYIAACIAATLLNSDWTWAGVLFIIAFYYAGERKIKILLYPLPVYMLFVLSFIPKGPEVFTLNLIQLSGISALFLLCFYNGKKGPNMKYFFYIFYPLHLLVIYLIKSNILF
ncbi:MAG: hypothetical protein IJL30_01170 [Clostridia bacterium]|nr:hypothetical protein [Clostridia bacterium]